jgi:hypothetical protein
LVVPFIAVNVAVITIAVIRARRRRDTGPTTPYVMVGPTPGPCRRCGRPTAIMHGDLVHTTEAGIFVATEHRPLPVNAYGEHPAAGVSLASIIARGGVR